MLQVINYMNFILLSTATSSEPYVKCACMSLALNMLHLGAHTLTFSLFQDIHHVLQCVVTRWK